MSTSHQNKNRTSGFTLVELVVVLAVLLLLAGIAVPLVSGYIGDGQRARAKSEVKVFGAAVMSMYKDVAIYPARNSSGKNSVLRVLGSGSEVPKSNPFTNSSKWNSWLMNSSYGDVMDNHLLRNTPQGSKSAAYPTTGEFQWRGPYLAGGASNDPWGRPYLVMVLSFHSTNGSNYKRVIVLSAGPDGMISTSSNCKSTTEIAGDDIGFVLSERR